MTSKFIWEILQEINAIWFGISLISILFFFFFVKVKFQKRASLKAYGVLFYAFVFYSIAALSFVTLNAMDTFFRLSQDIYSNFIWFFPITLFSSLIGALIGWIIYYTGTKVAGEYAFKLMNLSLLIIAPTLVFTLLIQPIQQTLAMAIPIERDAVNPEKDITLNVPVLLDSIPQADFNPAIPSQLYDSLVVQLSGPKQLLVMNPLNGFSFRHPIRLSSVEQIYISPNPTYKQLHVLLNAPAIQELSEYLIMDSLGLLVYSSIKEGGLNRMSLSSNGHFLRLQKQVGIDSLSIGEAYRLNP